MPKVTMLRNLAPIFYRENECSDALEANDNKPHRAGEVYEVSQKFSELVISKGLAEAGEPVRAVPAHAAIRGVPAEVSQTDEAEALATIAKLKNKEHLQQVVDHDSRPAVKEAARKRIAAL